MRELRREQLTAAQAEAMKHILPFKEKQIRQRELEAEAEKAARIGNAQAAGQRAVEHLAGVDKRRLVVGDILSWNEAAIRVGASRWAILPQDAAPPAEERLGIRLSTGEPGQTCIEIVAGEAQAPEKPASSESRGPAFSRCSYGQVWPASLTVSPDGRMMALAVQPLENWRKMWVFRLGKEGWQADAPPPSLDEPELGYLEFAGWVPGNEKFLVAREIIKEGRGKTSFELWDRATLKVEKSADKPGKLTPFYRWQDPVWKGGTVAVR